VYVWLTDFVGWLPMPDGGEREAFLTADYNAEMIEHIARFPRLRDRAVFVGNPDDVVPDRFGPGLPPIREWVEAHYDFAGYVTGFDPAALGDRDELRRRLGYRPDERVCVVTVGGSGVGGHLLRRVIAAYPEARRLWTRALRRPRRALYLSSPIGLGHARRDLAIARELRAWCRACAWWWSPGRGSTRPPSRPTTGWRSTPMSTTCTCTWPPATWPWSRAA
jgi:predicted glycosyltransferase